MKLYRGYINYTNGGGYDRVAVIATNQKEARAKAREWANECLLIDCKIRSVVLTEVPGGIASF